MLIFIKGRGRWRTAPWMVSAFGSAVFGAAFVSTPLIVVQAFLVDAWCMFCLVSASFSFVILALGVEEPVAGLKHLKRVYRDGGSIWRVCSSLEDTQKKGENTNDK